MLEFISLWGTRFRRMTLSTTNQPSTPPAVNLTYDHTVDTQSLYLHWPFCPYKCSFCPFVALVGQDHYMTAYHQALCQELTNFINQYTGNRQLTSIFIGGGTPSTYPPTLLLDMFAILKHGLTLTDATEVVLEVNPGTVTPERVAAWQAAGINRISIGVQSLKSSVLQDFNRQHDVHAVYQALEQVAAVTENLSIDLILGLPGVSAAEWQAFIREIVNWPIKHLSIYFLTVHEGTPLFFAVRRKRIKLPNDELLAELYDWTVDFLAAHGFQRYEISNFAKPGYTSVHNQIYWQGQAYKGFGLGACSFDGQRRFRNQVVLAKYLQQLEAGESVTSFAEQLSPVERKLERLMLGLRQACGVAVSELLAERTPAQVTKLWAELEDLAQAGWLTIADGYCRLTTKGLLVENEIVVRLSTVHG